MKVEMERDEGSSAPDLKRLQLVKKSAESA